MITLGIESTAHTFGIGVLEDTKELGNERVMYTSEGGIHPREAAQFLADNAPAVFDRIPVKLEEVNLIAFSQGPGLGPSLRIGSTIAKMLSCYYKKPLMGVNHCIAHIDVGKWDTKTEDPLVVYVSGANTQLLGLKDKRYRIYGETLDIGLGNAIDVLGRRFGMRMPAGPELEKLAAEGKDYIDLPYTVKGMDLAFSGLLTAAEKNIGKCAKEDLAYSFQETIFSMLCEVSERALAHTQKKEIMLVGGVAQNKRLRRMFMEMAKPHGAKFVVPKPEYNGDNGLMIALTGYKMFKAGVKQQDNLKISQKFRTEDVEVTW
jgi:N6-L-threonylcarbamoyladenine synthase